MSSKYIYQHFWKLSWIKNISEYFWKTYFLIYFRYKVFENAKNWFYKLILQLFQNYQSRAHHIVLELSLRAKYYRY